jgi:hypothetical protein
MVQKQYTLTFIAAAIFCYSFVAMYFMRTYILPAMSSHVVDGHLGGDPQYYYQLAKELSDKILSFGIGVWELHPKGQGPSGIFSLIYAVKESQMAVILVNSVLHTIACCYLYALLGLFFAQRTALIASLPFIVSPFQMYLFSQINKDSFVACGCMILVYALTRAVEAFRNECSARSLFKWLLTLFSGAFLIFIGRPYVVLIIQILLLVVFILALSTKALSDLRQRRLSESYTGIIRFVCFGMAVVIICSFMTKGAASDITLSNLESVVLTDASLSYISDYPIAKTCLINTNTKWRATGYIPKSIDAKFKALFSQRCLYFMQLYDSNPITRISVLDAGIQPKSISEVVAYLPRAASVGFFSPFPSSWFQKYNDRISTFYCIVAFEVMLFYLSLAGLLCWLLKERRSLLLVPLTISAGVVIVYGLSVPFLGALYRYRYPFWMLLLCIGLGALITSVSRKSFWNRHQEYS